jgi:hypothetical protein
LYGGFKFVEFAAGLLERALQQTGLLSGEADVFAELFDNVAFGGDVAEEGAKERTSEAAAWAAEKAADEAAESAAGCGSTALTKE